jgi:hypothetical protein
VWRRPSDRGTDPDLAEAAGIAERLRCAPLKAAVECATTIAGDQSDAALLGS